MQNFDQYAEKGNVILREIAEELGIPENRELAGRVLRAVLHTLRNTIPPTESFKLISQLPIVIKGLYVESWNPYKSNPHVETKKDFVHEMIHKDFPVGRHDFTTVKDAENAIMSVFKVLQRHISAGEVEDIAGFMSDDLLNLWTMRSE